MFVSKLDEKDLEKPEAELVCGGPKVGTKEKFRMKMPINEPQGGIGIETFPPGQVTSWNFFHDEVQLVLGGKVEINYTLPPNHTTIRKVTVEKGHTILIIRGTRAKFNVISKEPYLHAAVIMPRFHMEKWMLKQDYEYIDKRSYTSK